MVMASNLDEYAVVRRAKYKELWIEDNGIWNHQGNGGKHDGSGICYNVGWSAWWSVESSNASINFNARDNGISRALSKGEVAGGKGKSCNVEDMFVDDVGMHATFYIPRLHSTGLDFSDDVQSVEHGQWHGGVYVSKRNSKHVNENDKGNEDDVVLEFFCG
ncbi:hypothetical protein D8674_026590 [Pyrus ussuriensis x Pyrus communis]|uniref:Uncharacterized protein n=1 Tax=Pyrus ussuriensis x Pyrus communis TaxID=2448454 RepID=A0A5N5I7B0_9ROSA|nr:hypothetical protein D8674_026590 [Pyrus ussuriensis x Pyrus communis]